MPNTFTQIHLHFVFAVKNRDSLVHEGIRNRVEKYMTGIVQNFGYKPRAVYCMPDHAHMFVGFRPAQSIADFMREGKANTSEFINREKLTKHHFNWQEGYGAFSYWHSHVQHVIDYVLSQPEHHRKKTFREEYLEFLEKFQSSYREKYLFDWIETGATPLEPQASS